MTLVEASLFPIIMALALVGQRDVEFASIRAPRNYGASPTICAAFGAARVARRLAVACVEPFLGAVVLQNVLLSDLMRHEPTIHPATWGLSLMPVLEEY
jgi:hypothetical protein